jgi:hypothetical protein
VVYRHDWNEIDQGPQHGLPEKRPVARVFADGPEAACQLAARQVTLLGGQTLSAEPADEVDAKVHDLSLEAEALSPERNP